MIPTEHEGRVVTAPHEYVPSAPHTAPEDQIDCCPHGPSHPIHNVHSDAAHRAIEAELVRLTLGGRGPSRPELRVDLLGKVYQAARAARAVADHMRTSWLAAARAIAAAGITPPRTP